MERQKMCFYDYLMIVLGFFAFVFVYSRKIVTLEIERLLPCCV